MGPSSRGPRSHCPRVHKSIQPTNQPGLFGNQTLVAGVGMGRPPMMYCINDRTHVVILDHIALAEAAIHDEVSAGAVSLVGAAGRAAVSLFLPELLVLSTVYMATLRVGAFPASSGTSAAE